MENDTRRAHGVLKSQIIRRQVQSAMTERSKLIRESTVTRHISGLLDS